jgi:hypothetical protein
MVAYDCLYSTFVDSMLVRYRVGLVFACLFGSCLLFCIVGCTSRDGCHHQRQY